MTSGTTEGDSKRLIAQLHLTDSDGRGDQAEDGGHGRPEGSEGEAHEVGDHLTDGTDARETEQDAHEGQAEEIEGQNIHQLAPPAGGLEGGGDGRVG